MGYMHLQETSRSCSLSWARRFCDLKNGLLHNVRKLTVIFCPPNQDFTQEYTQQLMN